MTFAKEEKSKAKKEADLHIKSLEKTVDDLKQEVLQHQQVNVLLEKNEIETFEDGKYTSEIRKCCMDLLTQQHVNMRQLPGVIKTVLENLTGKLPTRLQSLSLLSDRIMIEAKVIALKQSATAMLKDIDPQDGQGNVIHQDATTKWHSHYEEIQSTLKTGESLG